MEEVTPGAHTDPEQFVVVMTMGRDLGSIMDP